MGHVLIYSLPYYLAHPAEILAFRQGGMSFIGGGIGVMLALVIYKKKLRLSFKEFLLLFDIVLVMLPVGIFLGRFGNFLNQELYGLPIQELINAHPYRETLTPTLKTLGLIHTYPQVDQLPRINTNFLAMLGEGILLLMLNLFLFFKQKKKQNFLPGTITATFVLGYSVIRFFLEYLRADSQQERIGVATKSQRRFLLFMSLGMLLALRVRAQRKNAK